MVEIIAFILLLMLLFVLFLFCTTELILAIRYLRNKDKKTHLSLESETLDMPFVTIQLPIFNEQYVVERIISSAISIDYPKDKYEIQVLDDSTDETLEISRTLVEKYKEAGYNIELLHRVDRSGFKAGALQAAHNKAKGNFVAIFDADFIIPRNFLKETLKYFTNDNIGLVQAKWAHLNENFSSLTKIQSFFLDLHFTVQQRGRNCSSCYINFNGTAGVWRKSCINDSGGWTPDTLTEDLDISYRAQMKGWQLVFLEDVKAPAELPVYMSAVRTQQFRWVKGGAQVARKLSRKLIFGKRSLNQKWFGMAHLISTTNYLFTFLAAVISVLLMAISDRQLLKQTEHAMLFYMISSLSILFACYVAYKASKSKEDFSIIHFNWRFLLFMCFCLGLSFQNAYAVAEGLIGIKSDFIRTPKFNIVDNKTLTNKSALKYLTAFINWKFLVEIVLFLYFAWAFIWHLKRTFMACWCFTFCWFWAMG